MDPEIAREKLLQAKAALRGTPFDCWLLLTREGSDDAVPLLTGGRSIGPAAFLIYADGTDEALVANFDAGEVRRRGVFHAVESYDTGLLDPLVARLRARGVKRVAMNYAPDDSVADGLSHGLYLWFRRGVAGLGIRMGSSAPLMRQVVGVKAPPEVHRIRRACRTAAAIMAVLRDRVGPGLSERDVAALFLDEASRRGVGLPTGEGIDGPLVLLPRVGMAHRKPGDERIEPGDALIIDASVVVDGYACDIARTFYAPRAGETAVPPELARMFHASRRAMEAACGALRPGQLGCDVDQAARQVLENAGYPGQPMHAVGHQVGRRVHDGGTVLGPRWERYHGAADGTVEAGMVFAVEPTVMPGGPYAVLTEENVLVTPDGVQPLSAWQEEVWLLRGPARRSEAH
jgi:Xaa-Pro aminopeptidase